MCWISRTLQDNWKYLLWQYLISSGFSHPPKFSKCALIFESLYKRPLNHHQKDHQLHWCWHRSGESPNRFIPRGDRRPAPFQQLNHWACDAWELLYAKRPPENNVPKQLQHHALDLKLGMLKAFLREDIYIVAKRYTLFEKLKNPMSQSFVC